MSGNWLDLSSSSNRYIQTYMKGFLDMSGGNLLLRNNNIIVNSGDISLNGRIFVSNDASLSGRLFVSKDLSLNSRLFVGSDVSMNGNVYARGTIITDASSYTDVKGGFIVENNVNVTGIINQSTINLSGGYIYLPSNVTTEQYNTLVGSLAAVNNVIQTTYVGAVSSYGGGTVTRVGLPPYAGGPNIITQTMADNWVSGNLLVAGSTTLNTNQVTGGPGSLYVAGSVNVPNGNLVVGGNVSLLNNTLNMAIGNITLTGGNVTLNNGYIQTSGNIMTTNGTVHSANDISVNGLVFGKGPGGNNIVLGSTLLSTANVYTINNLALGKNSLTSISNNGSGTYGAFGSNNTTVGFSAGSGITYGNNNTVVGYNSGSGMTIGNNNTFLGGNTTTSSGAYAQSTAVGFGATIAGSNQVVLGTSTESVIVAGNVGIGRTGVPTYSLDVSGTINARGEIISSGCYFSQQYTYTTTAATTTYLKLGTVWGNFTEHVLTQYNTGYTGSLRIIVDAAQRAGLYLPNTPIQLISSIANNNCIITNVFIVAPTGGLTDTSIGELWIQVTSNSAGQTIVHSWRSMAATNHFNNTGTAIGTQTSTAMPPLITTTSPATATDYVVVATYTPNSATGSGGSTAFMGQKVGVGIAAPAYTLDVSGVGRFSSGATYTALASVSASNTPLVVSADTTGSYASDLGQIVISGKTNTALRLGMMIDTTNNIGKIQGGLSGTGTLPIALNPMGGNVGIGTGTTAPTYNLDVTGTGRFTSDVSINGNLVVGNLLVRGGLTVQQLQNQNIINTTTTNYQLIVTEDISMNGRLFVSGNIGIGTLAPNSPLNVIGSNTSVNNRQITVGSNYDVSSVNDRLGAVVFSNNNNNAEQARIESCCNVGGAGNNADLRFFTRLDFVTYNERMRIDRAGNVGIGTTTPQYTLDVSGPINANNGSNGIAFSSFVPAIPGAGNTTQSLIQLGTGNYGCKIGGGLVQNSGPILTMSTINAGTTTEAMRILNTNVGIGTTAPSYKLDVNTNNFGFSITGGSPTYSYYDVYTIASFITPGTYTFTPSVSMKVGYVVVGGGGGGGCNTGNAANGGSGGATAYSTLTNGPTLNAGTAYTIVVGAGGAGATVTGNTGVDGTPSTISGTGLTTITGTGGKGGYIGIQATATVAVTATGGSVNLTSGVGCPTQTGTGGAGTSFTISDIGQTYQFGGGGGAGYVSSGVGYQSNMRVGGGGGGGIAGLQGNNSSSGGVTGSTDSGANGAPNTGGGGGGTTNTVGSFGGNGGSGIVILYFNTNKANILGGLSINSSCVGIGTMAPAYDLDVNGIIRANKYITAGGGYITSGTNGYITTGNGDDGSVPQKGALRVGGSYSTGTFLQIQKTGVFSWGSTGNYNATRFINCTGNAEWVKDFNVGPGGVGIGFAPPVYNKYGVDGLYVNGNVGIGTNAPAYTLDVTGTGRFTSDVSINGNLVIKGGLTVQQLQNQNIINMTTTNYQLIVTEDISLNGSLYVSGNTTHGPPLAVASAGNQPQTSNLNAFHSFVGNTVTGSSSSPIMAIYNNNATSATVLNDPTPILALRRGGSNGVNWDATASFNLSRYANTSSNSNTRLDIALANTSNNQYADTNIMTLQGNGNVGIGTTAPSKMLTVAGDALINGITVGTGGGSSIYNVAIGYNVLSSNSLAISGVQNIAIGPNALTTNVNAYQNIAIGQNALTLANGTSGNGSQNVSVGVDAGKAITTGYQNAIFGSGSLNLTTTGGFNTAIGAFCANANITGSYNTYLGYGATANANNWSNSTAIGYNSVITGSNLIVLGTTAETTYVPGKLTSNSTLTANSDLATNGSYYSSQYTLAISTAGTTYYRIGYVGATYMEQVLTTEIAGQVGHIRITVDSTSWVGNNLTNVPIQITTSMSSSYTCIIQNVYVVYSNTAPSNQTNGELWIKVVSGGGGQTIYQSWNSKGTSGHYANMGTPIGNTSSTTMPPTGFTIKATYPINYTAGSGGATGFVGQNVGIGTASPGVTLDVAGRARIDTTASTTPYLTLGQVGGLTANTGLWCSGQIALAGRLYFYYNWAIYANNGGNMYFLYGGAPETGTGGAYVTAGGVWTNSDLKFKHSINDLSIGLKEVLKLRPVTYVLNLLPERGEQIGFIAQELQEQVPLVVEFDKDNDGLCVNYVQIIPVLAKAIQEQNVIVQELKSENADLKSRLNALEARLTAAGF